MTTGHVFVATSLDGFIARKNHALDWLPQEKTEGEDLGYDTFVSSLELNFINVTELFSLFVLRKAS